MKPVKLIIGAEKIVVDINELLVIEDINNDMIKVAAQLGYWSKLIGAAEAEKIEVDAFYRRWRAEAGYRLLEKDAKLAEWKVRQVIEADDQFEILKKAQAAAAKNVATCRGICDSLRIKAQMLQSKGAMMRAELDSTGMSTPSKTSKSAKASTSDAGAMDAMRTANKKRKKTK